MSKRSIVTAIAVVAVACSVVGAAIASNKGRSPKQRPLPRSLVRSFRVLQGLRTNEARAIPNRSHIDIWLIPHARRTCLRVRVSEPRPPEGFATDCVPNTMALAGKMSPIQGGPTGVTVVGLAPNGNQTVRLALRNGSSEVARVIHNVYIAHARYGFKTVTLRDSAGVLRTWGTADG